MKDHFSKLNTTFKGILRLGVSWEDRIAWKYRPAKFYGKNIMECFDKYISEMIWINSNRFICICDDKNLEYSFEMNDDYDYVAGDFL